MTDPPRASRRWLARGRCQPLAYQSGRLGPRRTPARFAALLAPLCPIADPPSCPLTASADPFFPARHSDQLGGPLASRPVALGCLGPSSLADFAPPHLALFNFLPLKEE